MTLIAAARVLAGGGVLEPGWIEIAGSEIVAVGGPAPPRPPDQAFPHHWVAPGFVDLHVHGGGGSTFTDGDPEAARRVVGFHRAHGTTTMLASLITAPLDHLAGALGRLRALVGEDAIAGVHLEGPFLNPDQRGAHDAELMRAPDRSALERLIAAGDGALRMVTLAPELEGGIAAVERLTAAGVIVAIGHSDAGYEVTRAAVDAGARVATHLGNGMRTLHHRDPGPIPALLEDDRVVVELIADGVHLHPAMLRGFVRVAGAGRTALITDAIAAAGEPDGVYRLGGLDVVVSGGVARLADGGSLAGSTLTMEQAVRTAVVAGIPTPQALRAASSTPARVLGLADRVGTIAPGFTADLVVLDEDLLVQRVMTAGDWLQ